MKSPLFQIVRQLLSHNYRLTLNSVTLVMMELEIACDAY